MMTYLSQNGTVFIKSLGRDGTVFLTWIFLVWQAITCYYMLVRAITWYYLFLHAITCHYMLGHDISCLYMLLHASTCFCMLLHAIKYFYILFTCYYMLLHDNTSYYMLLQTTASYSKLLHPITSYYITPLFWANTIKFLDKTWATQHLYPLNDPKKDTTKKPPKWSTKLLKKLRFKTPPGIMRKKLKTVLKSTSSALKTTSKLVPLIESRQPHAETIILFKIHLWAPEICLKYWEPLETQ